jgi:hypothetical protein
LRRRLLHPAPDYGPTGHSPPGQHNGSQGDKLAETQAHRTA